MAEKAEVIEVAEVIEDPKAEIEVHPIGQVSIYRSQDPEQQLAEARARAKALVEVVREQNLAQSFGGGRKPHVNVEGWTFLASQFGLIPDIEWTRELEDGWEARATLRRLADGAVITHAESECRRSEVKGGKQRWKNANSFEIRSMAQTRATSKVCRNALSSIMVLAGFAATPAEEMDGVSGAGGTVAPLSPGDPHCPACLAVHGKLIPLQHGDKKPYWRCTRDGSECGGPREYKGKTYSWAGWHKTFEASREEWLADNPQHAGPQTKTVEEKRSNYWDWILQETVGTLGFGEDEQDDARAAAKAALVLAITDNRFDPELPLGEPLLGEPTDEQLRKIATNMTPTEAQIVVGALGDL